MGFSKAFMRTKSFDERQTETSRKAWKRFRGFRKKKKDSSLWNSENFLTNAEYTIEEGPDSFEVSFVIDEQNSRDELLSKKSKGTRAKPSLDTSTIEDDKLNGSMFSGFVMKRTISKRLPSFRKPKKDKYKKNDDVENKVDFFDEVMFDELNLPPKDKDLSRNQTNARDLKSKSEIKSINPSTASSPTSVLPNDLSDGFCSSTDFFKEEEQVHQQQQSDKYESQDGDDGTPQEQREVETQEDISFDASNDASETDETNVQSTYCIPTLSIPENLKSLIEPLSLSNFDAYLFGCDQDQTANNGDSTTDNADKNTEGQNASPSTLSSTTSDFFQRIKQTCSGAETDVIEDVKNEETQDEDKEAKEKNIQVSSQSFGPPTDVDPNVNSNFQLVDHFLTQATQRGIPLIFYQSRDADEDEWVAHPVTLYLVQGRSDGEISVPPKIMWVAKTNDSNSIDNASQNKIVYRHFDLTEIHSIIKPDSPASPQNNENGYFSDDDTIFNFDGCENDEKDDNSNDMEQICFSITSIEGEVFLFEASDRKTRNYIVDNLNLVLSRMSSI